MAVSLCLHSSDSLHSMLPQVSSSGLEHRKPCVILLLPTPALWLSLAALSISPQIAVVLSLLSLENITHICSSACAALWIVAHAK